jgi:hypothetical protein
MFCVPFNNLTVLTVLMEKRPNIPMRIEPATFALLVKIFMLCEALSSYLFSFPYDFCATFA